MKDLAISVGVVVLCALWGVMGYQIRVNVEHRNDAYVPLNVAHYEQITIDQDQYLACAKEWVKIMEESKKRIVFQFGKFGSEKSQCRYYDDATGMLLITDGHFEDAIGTSTVKIKNIHYENKLP